MVENENAVQRAWEPIPETTSEPEARKIMFDAAPFCHKCGDDIDHIEDAIALLVLGRVSSWKLLHRAQCYAEVLFFGDAPTLSPLRGISPRDYLARFGR